MAVLFVYIRVMPMNGTDDEAKAVDMSRYNGIMKPGNVGWLWIKNRSNLRVAPKNGLFFVSWN